MSQVFDKLLDARGLNCPMPLVNARKEIGKLELGQVLRWWPQTVARSRTFRAGRRSQGMWSCLGQETESTDGADVYVHYVKRAA